MTRSLATFRTSRKTDKYCNPWYRAWEPSYQGGCRLEDRIVVLVHSVPHGDDALETKPPLVYMTLKEMKQRLLIKLKELLLGVLFGTDLMFTENAVFHKK